MEDTKKDGKSLRLTVLNIQKVYLAVILVFFLAVKTICSLMKEHNLIILKIGTAIYDYLDQSIKDAVQKDCQVALKGIYIISLKQL